MWDLKAGRHVVSGVFFLLGFDAVPPERACFFRENIGFLCVLNETSIVLYFVLLSTKYLVCYIGCAEELR